MRGSAGSLDQHHQQLVSSCSVLPALPVAPQETGASAAAAKARTALDEMGTKGEFARKDSIYRQWIRKGGEFEPEGEVAGIGGCWQGGQQGRAHRKQQDGPRRLHHLPCPLFQR